MKRKICFVTLFVLLATLLCGGWLTASAEVPAGYPAIIEGLDFGGAEVFIYDWYSSGERVANPNPETQKRYDYIDWLQSTYNVKIREATLSDWAGMTEALTDMVAAHDSSRLCIVTLSGGFAGKALTDGLFMPWTYGLDLGIYNKATTGYMTLNGKCYGVGDSAVEPRQGVFFNKRILEEASIDWNELYNLQKAKTWTWEKLEGYMDKVQRDIDNDGMLDIWALTGNGDDITIALAFSNNADYYAYDSQGKLVPSINTTEMKEAISRRQLWQSKYMRPTESWDDYQRFWAQGNTAFMIGQAYEGFNGNGTINQVADAWGFVAMPLGPHGTKYTSATDNNVYGVPNVFDSETSLKLQKIFTLYSMPTPNTDANTWASGFYGLTDERAIEETYAMLRQDSNATVMLYNLIGDRNSSITEITWAINEGTVDEIIAAAQPAFQKRCDKFNDLAWDPESMEKVNSFVTRCYNLILNRAPDEGGLTSWCLTLSSKQATAAQIIDGFVKSSEFTNRNLPDSDKVDILYKTMLNREADAGGKAGWVDALSKGYTLQNIINGFCGSAEFTALCKDYGIEPGTVEASVPVDTNTPRGKIEAFVKRCYQLILNRQADDGGLKGWSDALEGKTASAAQIIDGFVRSPEYINRKLSAEDSVEILYKTMLNREADAGGKAGWVDALGKGYTLQNIINGFCGSAEFAAICAEYGIDAGSVNVAMAAAINAALTAKSLPDERIGNAVSADEAGQTTVIGYEPEEAEAFVKHAYREALGREADEAGLASWTEQILTGAVSPKAFLRTLLNSEEMKSRNLSDEEFVTVLYRLYLKRVPDEAAAEWIGYLAGGVSREELAKGFESSVEFRVVLNGFGL